MGRRAGVLGAAALFVAAVVYGPMLLLGYPLRFDLVSVPRPVLGDDALGFGDRLPRAVPLDAFTAVLARVVPDAWTTQVVALLALTLAGWGVALLTPAPLPGRLVTVLVAEWNPFVVEQLAIGHVPHLCAYGAVPWVVLAVRRMMRGPRRRDVAFGWCGLAAAGGFGSLTPGGGVLVGIATLGAVIAYRSTRSPDEAPERHPAKEPGLFGAGVPDRPADRGERRGGGGPTPSRTIWGVVGLVTVVGLQLPWLVAAAASPGLATDGDAAAGVAAFALRDETGWGRLIDAAGLGGMWNEAALPTSRTTVLAKVSTVLVLALVVLALPAVRRLHRSRRAQVWTVGGAMALGYVVAVLPVLPGGAAALESVIEVVPGAGLLRDGHRWLALPALGVAGLAGLAVTDLAARLPARFAGSGGRSARLAVAVLAALLVVASIPDAAFGLDGRLRARHYPSDWTAVRAVLDRSADRSRVLVLPWQPFRVFPWSGPDAVLDPAPRLIPRQTIVSDSLTIAGVQLDAEGPGARAITGDLRDGALNQGQLRVLAIGWILVEGDTPGTVPTLPGGWTTVYAGDHLALLRSPEAQPPAPRASADRTVGVVGTQILAGGLLGVGVVGSLIGGLLDLSRSAVRRRRRRAPVT